MKACTTLQCGQTATWVPVLEVVGEGSDFDTGPLPPLRAFLTKQAVCHRCMLQLNPHDLLTPNVKRMMTLSAEGGPAPDFERARVRPLAISSPDLQEIQRRAFEGGLA